MSKDAAVLLLGLLSRGSVCNCRVVRALERGSRGIFRLGTNALCPLLRKVRSGGCLAICRGRINNGIHGCCDVAGAKEGILRRGGRR